MFDFTALTPLFSDEALIREFSLEQVATFYDKFKDDFINSPFEVDGKPIKIVEHGSKIQEYSHLCETFTHIITRGSTKNRLYDCERANRAHWIKPILQNNNQKEVLYYRWLDGDGTCKHHYWLISKSFMVVLKTIGNFQQIVTAFCVDNDQKLIYYERFMDFRDGKGSC
jgi:hypothetical protein